MKTLNFFRRQLSRCFRMKPRPLHCAPPAQSGPPAEVATPYHVDITYGNIDDYSLGRQLGRGKYSNVFKGYQRNGNPCVVKVLKPVRPEKIRREISILQKIVDAPHVSKLLDICHDPESGAVSLILDWSENTPIKEILCFMSLSEIANYMKSVLQALEYAHARGIMHRDVKPDNIMYDPTRKYVKLIDWGLAEYYQPGRRYPVRVATRNYKGPELLLNFERYTPSLDMWCLGCTFAAMLFKISPFFKGSNTEEQVVMMSRVFGSAEILAYAKKYELRLRKDVIADLERNRGRSWEQWITEENRPCDETALDLLKKLLIVDHEMRITPTEALNHPFFKNAS